MSEEGKLRKVAEVEILGERYDVARNGRYRLVCEIGKDDYGQPINQALLGGDFSGAGEMWNFCEALIDCLGEALEKLQGHEAARERRLRDVP